MSNNKVSLESSGKISLIELKNGKVLFKQKPHSFEKHSETLQELVKFREMLQERATNGGSVLTAIDDEHKPLIAKLAHESDKTLTALAKHIHSILLPTDDDDEGDAPSGALLLPSSIIESAIQAVAQRNNYGIQTDLGVKAPALTCVWRWEVKESCRHWLPKSAQDKAANRLADRIKAKNDLMAIFTALPEDEQRNILHIKSHAKSQSEDKGKAPATAQNVNQASGSSQGGNPPQEETETPEQTKAKVGRPKKDAEKAAKAKKQKDAQKTLMTSFFTKPKASAKPLSSKAPSSSAATVAGPSIISSDFDKTFKPFVLKKGAQLAPINAFLERKPTRISASGNGTHSDVIVIDDDDEPLTSTSTTADISNMNAQDRLRQILSSMPPPVAGPLKRPPKSTAHGMKTYNPVAARDIFKQLSEVEILGDATLARKLHNKLSDRALLPAKVFIFDEDARPGYYGTWTRSSRTIGPRTPHAKDVLEIEYGYDSGEDWEEESAGDADDVMDDAADEDVTEDRDSDIDDWLVDDEEAEEGVDGRPRSRSRSVSPLVSLVPKRKADDVGPKAAKKRKVVVPLVPFAKGPCWETSIGQGNNAFNSYRIRLLNDTPFPIDPFTFVSEVDDRKPVKSSEKGFVVPALPSHVTQVSAAKGAVVSAGPKKALTPKTPFPDEHLPVLISKINTIQAANLTVLVEAVSQELREYKVKKNAIEAKIREVGERCKVRKYWVVKENYPVAQSNATWLLLDWTVTTDFIAI
ncbi:hypothetical protein BT96DRAFT_915389 [Gymnopus androsaceus JB14]|uniref:Chromatin assembly factor 1 subunit A dimerization domain-containing protein n=1 Tax=Gymnopus androsaceus JB14 TaxID=1447944 RepID=A0A6A4I9A9_9AGAR|nr:hypothetical protein BT96DRAFT_915389 [Gymnopus androsaceus JB14]